MRSLLVSFAALALVASGPEAWAAQSETNDQVEPGQDGEWSRLVQLFFEQFYSGKYSEALATADKLRPDASNSAAQSVRTAMRAAALLGLKKDQEAAQLFADAARIAPTLPVGPNLQFEAGLVTGNHAVATTGFDLMMARFPDAVREIGWDSMRWFVRELHENKTPENEQRIIDLARIGYGADAEWGDYVASSAVRFLVKRADMAAAGDLLRYIDDPQLIENMLVQKRFSALWPQLEELAGPNLTNVRRSSVASAERAYAESPNDHDKLSLLANALRYAGRADDAIALRSKLPQTREQMAAADEKMGWAVNNVAYALHSAGRAEEADALFAMLNEAPVKEPTWRISMEINRVAMLVDDGKFERAFALMAATEALAKVNGSPYARQLVRRMKYCTLSRLGKLDAAAKFLPELLAHADDARDATISALLCAGQVEKAEEVALAGLGDDDFQEDFVRSLQRRSLGPEGPPVPWEAAWHELRRRPAIARQFERLGRDMPEQFLPSKVSTAR